MIGEREEVWDPEIISHAVWHYYRFALSHRDVEEVLAERGVQVGYEAIRLWGKKFGPTFGAGLRWRRAGDKWHLDEVQLKIRGRKHRLWRAVDRDGLVLDILVQERRNQHAAETFLRRVLDGEDGAPRGVVTDTLASYPPGGGSCRAWTTGDTKASTTGRRSRPSHPSTSTRTAALQGR